MCFFHVAKGRLYFYASLFCALFCIWHIKEISKNLPLATALKGGFNMSRIMVNNLTFYYEGSPDYIFDHVSFSIDTNWKLGFIGRNGKGKTTFLNLLLGAYEYQGTIDKLPYLITILTLSFQNIWKAVLLILWIN